MRFLWVYLGALAGFIAVGLAVFFELDWRVKEWARRRRAQKRMGLL